MGTNDLMLVASRGPARLIGLLGAFGAGKTSLLTSLFANLSKTGLISSTRFAGSYSLQAWAQLKKYTDWPSIHGPTFPPHTPDSADRVPGLLHLAFRSDDNLIQDLLFTDAPGEWFTRWIRNQSSEGAAGARWIIKHSSHFVFFVDREALNGPDLGRVRQDLLSMARILAEHREGRPVIVVWSKCDLDADEAIEVPIQDKLNGFFGFHDSLQLQSTNGSSMDLLLKLLQDPPAPPQAILKIPLKTNSAFFAYGQ